MEMHQTREAFETIGGRRKFSFVEGLFHHEGRQYYAKWHDRRRCPNSFESMYDIRQINSALLGPSVTSRWTVVAPDPSNYVKSPDVFAHVYGLDVARRLENEIEVCELIRKNPHPNIAIYHGCLTSNDRVTGLCFKRYRETLAHRANPSHLDKVSFISCSESRDYAHQLANGLWGILDAIRHLHTLGVVHNDVTPSNIMFDESDRAILIDFDSCSKIGEDVPKAIKRTPGWFDPCATTPSPQDDVNAFVEVMLWLTGTSSEHYMFM